ncbi:unnamed protein product [Larinioides sclopetarius]|uniref:Uncharacterized protein n=1 Tax=Larinioides sclopetarius TaxID=280406 RepID=A0AAV1YSR9_9ARAC
MRDKSRALLRYWIRFEDEYRKLVPLCKILNPVVPKETIMTGCHKDQLYTNTSFDMKHCRIVKLRAQETTYEENIFLNILPNSVYI